MIRVERERVTAVQAEQASQVPKVQSQKFKRHEPPFLNFIKDLDVYMLPFLDNLYILEDRHPFLDFLKGPAF